MTAASLEELARWESSEIHCCDPINGETHKETIGHLRGKLKRARFETNRHKYMHMHFILGIETASVAGNATCPLEEQR